VRCNETAKHEEITDSPELGRGPTAAVHCLLVDLNVFFQPDIGYETDFLTFRTSFTWAGSVAQF
jgi:hypothetical protein